MPKMTVDRPAYLSVRLPDEVKEFLTNRARENGVTRTAYLETLIRQHAADDRSGNGLTSASGAERMSRP